MKNIWHELEKPVFILAPMDDVTDTVFRRMVLSTARPDLFFTEFANVDGLISTEGKKTVEQKLVYDISEHPIIAQLWGNNPEHFFRAGEIIRKKGFDGVDVNFGCPIADVVKKGCGAGAIGNINLVREIIHAVSEGSKGLPVSIKTRLGIKKIETEAWMNDLLTLPLSAITIHARTASEMSKVPAHWEEIKKAVEMRNSQKKNILIIGNGDVKNRADGLSKIKETGADGIMIGRGIFHDMYAFKDLKFTVEPTITERLSLLESHVRLYKKIWKSRKPFSHLKKYFKIYISGFDGASDMRMKFMETNSCEEAYSLIGKIKQELLG